MGANRELGFGLGRVALNVPKVCSQLKRTVQSLGLGLVRPVSLRWKLTIYHLPLNRGKKIFNLSIDRVYGRRGISGRINAELCSRSW